MTGIYGEPVIGLSAHSEIAIEEFSCCPVPARESAERPIEGATA